MNSEELDWKVLRNEEVKLLRFLRKHKSASVEEMQEGVFGTKRATAIGGEYVAGSDYKRKKGKQYVSGTSLVRNLLRRLKRKLIEPTKEAGCYRLTPVGRKLLSKVR